MNRIIKPAVIFSAVVLIYCDISSLFRLEAVSGAVIFNTVFTHYIPAGLLVSVAALLYYSKSNKTKMWAIVSAVVSVFMAAVRLLALIIQFIYIFRGTGATGKDEYFEIANFSGGILILIGMFFLALFFINGKFKKTALGFMLVSVVTFIVYHIADVVSAVSSMNEAGYSGIGAFFTNCFTYEFGVGVLMSLAYLLLFASVTGMLSNSENKKEKING